MFLMLLSRTFEQIILSGVQPTLGLKLTQQRRAGQGPDLNIDKTRKLLRVPSVRHNRDKNYIKKG